MNFKQGSDPLLISSEQGSKIDSLPNMKAKLHIQAIDITIDIDDGPDFDLKAFLEAERERVNDMVIHAMQILSDKGAALVQTGSIHFSPTNN